LKKKDEAFNTSSPPGCLSQPWTPDSLYRYSSPHFTPLKKNSRIVVTAASCNNRYLVSVGGKFSCQVGQVLRRRDYVRVEALIEQKNFHLVRIEIPRWKFMTYRPLNPQITQITQTQSWFDETSWLFRFSPYFSICVICVICGWMGLSLISANGVIAQVEHVHPRL
jgi:hypothetical protein